MWSLRRLRWISKEAKRHTCQHKLCNVSSVMDNLKTLTEYMLWVTITNDLFMVEKHKNLKGKQDFSSQSANRWFIRITAMNVGLRLIFSLIKQYIRLMCRLVFSPRSESNAKLYCYFYFWPHDIFSALVGMTKMSGLKTPLSKYSLCKLWQRHHHLCPPSKGFAGTDSVCGCCFWCFPLE